MDAVAVLDLADSGVAELMARCGPGREFARLDSILAGRVALGCHRLLADVARLLALVQPGGEEVSLEKFLFREQWASRTGEGLGLTRDGRLLGRGLTGAWHVLKSDATRQDLLNTLADSLAKGWKRQSYTHDGSPYGALSALETRRHGAGGETV